MAVGMEFDLGWSSIWAGSFAVGEPVGSGVLLEEVDVAFPEAKRDGRSDLGRKGGVDPGDELGRDVEIEVAVATEMEG